MNSKVVLLVVLIAAVIVVAAYFTFVYASIPEVVKAGDNVQVYYTGAFTNGTVFDSNVGGQPLNFTAGANEVIPGFDQAVIGMKLNETKNVTVPTDEAYGPVNPNLIVSFPINAFGNQTVKVGMVFTETSRINGRQFSGVVTAVNATNATLDFNPRLAGHTLVFTIKVVGIQKGH